jgi:hypothetical protein
MNTKIIGFFQEKNPTCLCDHAQDNHQKLNSCGRLVGVRNFDVFITGQVKIHLKRELPKPLLS